MMHAAEVYWTLFIEQIVDFRFSSFVTVDIGHRSRTLKTFGEVLYLGVSIEFCSICIRLRALISPLLRLSEPVATPPQSRLCYRLNNGVSCNSWA